MQTKADGIVVHSQTRQIRICKEASIEVEIFGKRIQSAAYLSSPMSLAYKSKQVKC